MSQGGILSDSGTILPDVETLTGNSGGAVGPTGGNINTLGTGSITIAGNPGTSTLTTQLTGLTNHAVLVGAGTATITKVGPVATTGSLLASQGPLTDPAFTTATYPQTTAQGDLLLSSTANAIVALAKDTNATRYLSNTGGNNNAAWSQINLSDGVTGVLTVSHGGTGLSSITANNLIIGNGTSAVTLLAPSATSGIPLVSQGAASNPAYSTAVVAGGGTGQTSLTAHSVLIGNGTSGIVQVGPVAATGSLLSSNGVGSDPGFTTATYPLTTTANQILYSSAANTVTGLSNGTNGQVIIAATGAVPAYASLTSTAGSLTYTTGANTLNIDIANFVGKTSFTPVLAFGGASVGITYSTQVGFYSRTNGVVYFSINIVTTSKGSSVGAATITGLPVASANDGNSYIFPLEKVDAAVLATVTGFFTQLPANSAVLSLNFETAATSGAGGLVDSNFNNAITLVITGFYFA